MKKKSLRVLIVEDSEDDILLLIHTLNKGGYNPIYKSVQSSSAMEKALKNKWDVILCDYKISKFSCHSVIKLLKKLNTDIPLIVIMESIEEGAAMDCMRLGAKEFVTKTNLMYLCPCIERILEETKIKRKQKQTEERIMMLANVVDSSDDAIITESLEGNITSWNKGAEFIYGYTAREVVGKNISTLLPSQLKDETKQLIEKIKNGERIVHYESIRVTKKGERINISLTLSPIFDVSGKLIGVSTIARDIMERKRAEEILKENIDKLNLILQGAEMGIWQINLSTDLRYFDDQVCRLLGIDPVSFNGTLEEFFGVVHPEDRENLKSMLARAIERDELYQPEYRVIRPDGSIHYVTARGRLFRDEAGKPLRFNGILWDITKRKKIEEELQRISSNQQILLSAIPDIVMEVDENKIYTWANKSGIEFFGEDVIGREAFFYFEGEQETYSIVEPLFKGSEDIYYLESWQRRKDGQKRLLAWWCHSLKDNNGKVTGALSTARDITESKLAEEEIRKLNEELEQRVRERTVELEAFTYSVSHDLRAPLRTIKGFSQILAEDYEKNLDENGKDYLKRIGRAALTMNELIEDMLKLYRISRLEVNLEKVDLSSVADSIIDELHKTEPERQVDVKIADSMEDSADRGLMHIALGNLFGNAWKFTGRKANAKIEFGRKKKNGETIYFIRDNGEGFDNIYVDKLFVPFQRLHSAEKYPGSGIGLVIVKRIIQRHGGNIWAEGRPGQGATFYFTLR